MLITDTRRSEAFCLRRRICSSNPCSSILTRSWVAKCCPSHQPIVRLWMHIGRQWTTSILHMLQTSVMCSDSTSCAPTYCTCCDVWFDRIRALDTQNRCLLLLARRHGPLVPLRWILLDLSQSQRVQRRRRHLTRAAGPADVQLVETKAKASIQDGENPDENHSDEPVVFHTHNFLDIHMCVSN